MKEQPMTEQVELMREINRLPSRYIGEVLDYVGYLQQKTQNENADEIEAYKAMAADTEREQEATEWRNAYFGPMVKTPYCRFDKRLLLTAVPASCTASTNSKMTITAPMVTSVLKR
jgi:hypothetical protein